MPKTTKGIIVSKDGTNIGYTKFGNGPAIVITHGSYSFQQDWFALAEQLAVNNTVFTYDRRGRGESIDTAEYSFEREIDDLAAIVNFSGAGTSLLGHSFGGGVVLAYLIRDGFTGKAILYEPMNSIFRQVSDGHYEEVKALITKGDLDAATFLTQTKVVGLPVGGVEMFRSSPYWSSFIKLTPIFFREMDALDKLMPTEADAKKIKAKTWLLLGTETWREIRIASAGVISILSDITLYPVVGQHHLAHTENPTLLKDLIHKCLFEK